MTTRSGSGEGGYAMAALLVALAVMGIMLSVALPTWRTMAQREREAELFFRGQQYVQAIELFSRRTGGFPTSFNLLRDGHYIRKLYKDPITNTDFQPVYLGQAPVGGAPVAPGQPGQPGQPAGRGGGRAGAPGAPGASPGSIPPATAGGRATQPLTPLGGAAPPTTGVLGQPGPIGAGPIIGVVSRSTAESIRLFNGRNHYNEWVFMTTAATLQPGAPGGAQGPAGLPGRGGRGAQPGAQQPGQPREPGRGRGFPPDGMNRGGPGRGLPDPNRGFPGGPNRGSPFGGPNGFPTPFNPGQRGRL
ncbi:MAG: hypothetical protein HY824_01395 [Acidobacteria bacterium]|nr:hypothetical protein [Acidobacteriota bacterium]